MVSLSSLAYCLWARPGAYPSASKRFVNRAGSCFTNKHETKVERLVRDKHSSLLRTFVNYGHKKFYNFGSRRRSRRIRTQVLREQSEKIPRSKNRKKSVPSESTEKRRSDGRRSRPATSARPSATSKRFRPVRSVWRRFPPRR